MKRYLNCLIPKSIGFLIIFYVVCNSCRPTFKVQSELITKFNPGQYKSYKFVNPKNIPESNFSFSDKNKKIIYDAVAEEMKNRGFISIQEADVLIKIQGGTSKESENKSRNNYYDPYNNLYGSFYGNPYYWGRDPWRYDDISKKITSIIIDVIDENNKKLIWEGVGTGVIGEKSGEVESRIKTAIKDIFLEFPLPDHSGKNNNKNK